MRLLNLSELERLRGLPRLTSDVQRGEYLQRLKESIAGWFSGTPVGDQFAALLGTFSLRPSGYLALAAQAVLIAAITAWASRRTLFATLDDID